MSIITSGGCHSGLPCHLTPSFPWLPTMASLAFFTVPYKYSHSQCTTYLWSMHRKTWRHLMFMGGFIQGLPFQICAGAKRLSRSYFRSRCPILWAILQKANILRSREDEGPKITYAKVMRSLQALFMIMPSKVWPKAIMTPINIWLALDKWPTDHLL